MPALRTMTTPKVLVFKAEGYSDVRRFTLPRIPKPRLEDVLEALPPGVLVKAQDHEGQWFNLTSDEELDEAVSATKGHTVPLFFAMEDNMGKTPVEFTQCPRAWVNTMWARQATVLVPPYNPQRYGSADEENGDQPRAT